MALSFLAKLLLTKKLVFKDGEIELQQIRLTITPSLFIYEIMRNYIENSKSHILYLLSWIGGFVTVYKLVKTFKAKNPEQIYNLGMNFGEAIGIGLYKTHEYYPGRYTHFIIYNNPFRKWIKPTGNPIDFFIAGSMAGGGCLVHNAICQNIEIKCIAKGDPYCEFFTVTEEEAKRRGWWEIIKERYQLEKIFPIQKFVYENIEKIDEKELVNNVLEMIKEIEGENYGK